MSTSNDIDEEMIFIWGSRAGLNMLKCVANSEGYFGIRKTKKKKNYKNL